MDVLERQLEIEKLLNEKGLSPKFVEVTNNGIDVEIRIEGDWKHAHRYMNYVMMQNGYTYVGYKDEEPTDGDWGCYTHVYTISLR
jgi:hypothetical protein